MSQPGPELRIGDSEREAAVGVLGEHYAAGRLSKDEFDERSAQAYAARTRSALWPLFSDLPRPAQSAQQPPPARTEQPTWGHPGWHWGARFLPLLMVVLVVSLVLGHPLVLLVVLGFFLLRSGRFWGHSRHYSRHPGPRRRSERGWQ